MGFFSSIKYDAYCIMDLSVDVLAALVKIDKNRIMLWIKMKMLLQKQWSAEFEIVPSMHIIVMISNMLVITSF